MSDFVEEGIINYFFRPNIAAPTRPTTVYLAAFSDDGPIEAGTGGTEIGAGFSYARVLVHNNTGSTAKIAAPAQVADAAESTNNAEIAFPANSHATDSYTIESLALVTTSSGAFTLLAKKILAVPVAVAPGQLARVLTGDLLLRSNVT